MPSFIQTTDTHFVPGDRTLYGTSPKVRLAEGIALINRDHASADFLLITGDLAHDGDAAAYETLRDVLAEATVPVHLMMGNHDSRAPFRRVFADRPEITGGFVQFALDGDGYRVLCLDSLHDEPARHEGRLCETRLAWLDKEIAATPADVKLVVACHHPPFKLGIPNMDDIRLTDGEAMWEVLQRRKPDQMIFGHVHRPICGNWRGIPFHLQRAFNHQVALDFERKEIIGFCEENADISVIRPTDDGVQIFTRSVGGEMRFFPSRPVSE
jgi:3',5'-cyclic AMP phosphodiesterase CpdA